jgi:flavorubredoxin
MVPCTPPAVVELKRSGENLMERAYQAVKILEDVYWVGAIDWNIRNFHGYLTGRGTTYNAYLVLGDKPALIDTVKKPFYDEMMARINSVIDPAKIEYIISNHSEMDHTGCLINAIEEIKPSKVLASKQGQRALTNHFRLDPESITVVGDGEELDLGDMKLSFVETRMCHWPDSMVSYLHERQLLFSQDAFGMHLAGYERFADEIPREILDYESAKYYANILLHLSPFVQKALDRIKELNLPLSMIAPDHGPVWRLKDDIARITASYAQWARQEPSRKAIVMYDSMWGSTAEMARAIGEGLYIGGLQVKQMNLSSVHRSDVVTELLNAGALVVGSPTMNNNIFPTVADVMTYIRGLRPKNLVTAVFGSYGWSGEALKQLKGMLEEMGLPIVAEPLSRLYVPDDQSLVQCRNLGLEVARSAMQR